MKVIFLLGLMMSVSYAQVKIPSSIDVTPIYQFAGVILSAIASIWVIRKIIKLGNKS